MKIIAIDNGTSGTIAILYENNTSEFHFIPILKEQSYTVAKKNITRINYPEFLKLLSDERGFNTIVLLERPFLNPKMFHASISAIRALEATLIAVEQLNMSRIYIDSKIWQKIMLPHGCKGTIELKKASLDIGCRLFPIHKEKIIKHKDADSLLMAEWYRQKMCLKNL